MKKQQLSWEEKYQLSLKQEFSIQDIMNLYDYGQRKAQEVRNSALKVCISRDVALDSRYVPSDAVFEVTKKGIKFFYKQRELENFNIEALNIQYYVGGFNYVY